MEQTLKILLQEKKNTIPNIRKIKEPTMMIIMGINITNIHIIKVESKIIIKIKKTIIGREEILINLQLIMHPE
jgi:hypothetical protein